MKHLNKSLISCFLLILLTIIAVNGWAANSAEPINGTVSVSGSASEVTWSIPEGNAYEIADLRVSPPGGGEVSIQNFYSSETPTFNPASGDGYYNYEITLHPALSLELQKKIQAAREDFGQGRVSGLPMPKVQSGGFRIHNGALVSNDTIEE